MHQAADCRALADASRLTMGRVWRDGYSPCSNAGTRPRRPRGG
ncbi:hypothetical protein [Brevundimonas sp.]|jgi:DNA polymerase-3 subunit epsilon|nr:hypothetical protein [Brevundimonas sp.]